MVKFKCKHTGNVFTFTSPHDIKTMREHDEYEEVIEDNEEVEQPKEIKPRGKRKAKE